VCSDGGPPQRRHQRVFAHAVQTRLEELLFERVEAVKQRCLGLVIKGLAVVAAKPLR
jgi:hypothetical protein